MRKDTKVICFANNKGGSGKSTTCSNVGYALSTMGNKVLLIDGDMQMNLTLSFVSEQEALLIAKGEKNLYWALRKEEELCSYIIPTQYEGLDLIPSSILMSSVEYELYEKKDRNFLLQKCLAPVLDEKSYDYILIDAPPTLGGWVNNILYASSQVLIPLEASPWGLFGLANLFEFIETAKKGTPQLSIMGIIITKADTRKSYFKQTIESLQETEGIHLFQTYIRVDSSIEWAQDNSQPVGAFRKSSRSAKEYMELAKEVDEIVSGKR